jgi:hypothetical protein
MGKLSLGFCALVVLSACATKPLSPEMVARLDRIASTREPAVTPVTSVSVVDLREPKSRRLAAAPMGIAGGLSCNMGVDRLGDEAFAADRIARMEAALGSAFSDRLSGSTIIVRRYDIYLNHTAESNSANLNAAFGGGLLAAAIAPYPNADSPQVTRVARCGRDRMQHGWFDQSDLSNNNPPVTVDLDVTVLGGDYAVNSALSPEVDFFSLGYGYGRETRPEAHGALEATVQHAMAKAEARLVAQVAANQSPLVPQPAAADAMPAPEQTTTNESGPAVEPGTLPTTP